MRDDHAGAAAALVNTSNALRASLAVAPVSRRTAACLIRAGQLIRDNPAVAAAAHELRSKARTEETRLREQTDTLSATATSHLKSVLDALRVEPETTRGIAHLLDTTIRTTVAPKSLRGMLGAAEPPLLSVGCIIDIGACCSTAIRAFGATAAAERPNIGIIERGLSAIESLSAEARRIKQLHSVALHVLPGYTLDILSDYTRAWTSALDIAKVATRATDELLLFGDEAHAVPDVLDDLATLLQLQICRRLAVHRLRVLFEDFDKDAVREELKNAQNDGRQREGVIQARMDRFLFHDGYFPLTHGGASGGFFDTLVLERAEDSGIPPILIELKQVTDLVNERGVTPAEVTAAIGVARGEVQRYKSSVAARTQWRGLDPIIVVVHTCVTDVSALDGEDVVLIDTSPVTPSKKLRSRSQ